MGILPKMAVLAATAGLVPGSVAAVGRYFHILGAGDHTGHFCPPDGNSCDIEVHRSVSAEDNHDKRNIRWKKRQPSTRGRDRCNPNSKLAGSGSGST